MHEKKIENQTESKNTPAVSNKLILYVCVCVCRKGE